MAEHNDPKDQEARSWGDKIADYFDMGVKEKETIKDAEDAVKKLKERNGRA